MITQNAGDLTLITEATQSAIRRFWLLDKEEMLGYKDDYEVIPTIKVWLLCGYKIDIDVLSFPTILIPTFPVK